MKKKFLEPTIGNALQLFSKRLDDFSGESKRSYQKAFSSFQLYAVGNYPSGEKLDENIFANWMVSNLLNGLSLKTVSFYLDKLSSLYTKIGHKFDGGRLPLFKNLKNSLRNLDFSQDTISEVQIIGSNLQGVNGSNLLPGSYLWSVYALKAGVLPEVVKNLASDLPDKLKILEICETREITEEEKEEAKDRVAEYLQGEPLQWFAMRLRPKVNYDRLMDRFSVLSSEIRMPELFYPFEEIAKAVGRKIVWKGRPVIRDVVFFRSRKSEIYNLFTKLYDLAWCYRTPGIGTGNYAAIPARAMEEFRMALGIIGPDFEVSPAGEMKLKPGDEVVIVTGEYASRKARILKESPELEDGKKIFRVTLLDSNGHWDIGIDARLLKKTQK